MVFVEIETRCRLKVGGLLLLLFFCCRQCGSESWLTLLYPVQLCEIINPASKKRSLLKFDELRLNADVVAWRRAAICKDLSGDPSSTSMFLIIVARDFKIVSFSLVSIF